MTLPEGISPKEFAKRYGFSERTVRSKHHAPSPLRQDEAETGGRKVIRDPSDGSARAGSTEHNVFEGPEVWKCTDSRWLLLNGKITSNRGTIAAWRQGGIAFVELKPEDVKERT